MKITHIELKDFGPHKHIDVDVDAGVVGITGSNGAGKSNLLQAICYALTGDLNKTNQQLYIRNFGQEDGAKKALVSVTFVKGGKQGRITREISASGSKRLLEWDGNEYRKQEDVDRVISEIVGADKSVLSSAVFIKQGQVADLVQGTPSERQAIFQKLTRLNFINRLDDMLQSKVAQLQAGVQDYRPQIIMLEDRQTSVTEELARLEQKLAELAPHAKVHAKATSLVSEANIRSSLLASYNEATHHELRTREKRNKLLDEHKLPLSTTEEDLDKKVSEVTARYKKLQEVVAAAKTVTYLREHVKEATERAEKLKRTIDEFGELVPLYEQLTEKVETSKKKLEDMQGRVKAIETIKEREYKLDCAKTALKEAEAHLLSVKESMSGKMDEDNKKLAVLKLSIKFKQALMDNPTDIKVCPFCGSEMTLDSSREHMATAVALEKAQVLELSDAIQTAYTTIKAAETSAEKAQYDVDTALYELDNAHASYIAAYGKSYSEEDRVQQSEIAALDKELHTVLLPKVELLKWDIESFTTAKGAYSTAESELNNLKTRLADAEKVVASCGCKEVTEKDAADALFDMNMLRSVAAEVRMAFRACEDAARRVSELDTSAQERWTRISSLINDPELASFLSFWEEQEGHKFSCDSADDRTSLSNLVSSEKCLLDELTGQQGSKAVELEKINSDLDRMRELSDKNRKRILLIQDLQKVRSVVGKNGAPKDYCHTVFCHITDIVQDLLVKMGSNFTVEPSEDQPLTYSFVRTDKGDGFSMGQERLSGGQAIRLALALLIACQQVVLPDVGLLVLDEPSSHVDAEGVESMRDMFLELGAFLDSADMQLIVVDHNKVLEAAFGKSIVLTGNKEA